jgi:hypothetical protein
MNFKVENIVCVPRIAPRDCEGLKYEWISLVEVECLIMLKVLSTSAISRTIRSSRSHQTNKIAFGAHVLQSYVAKHILS